MTDGRPSVVAAIADHEWCEHVRFVLHAWTTLTVIPTVREIPEGITPDVVLWHLGAAEHADDASIAALRHFRLHSPRSAVIAYCRISVPTAPLLVAAGRVGIDRLLLRGHDDLRDGVRNELRSGSIEAIGRRTVARLTLPDGMAWQILAHCVRRAATTVLTVERLAEDFGVHRRTLGRWLATAGLPSPEQVIGWGRLLLAASMLEHSRTPVAIVAEQLGFSSESAFRGMLDRYAGLTPRDLREPGGLDRIVNVLCPVTSSAAMVAPIRPPGRDSVDAMYPLSASRVSLSD